MTTTRLSVALTVSISCLGVALLVPLSSLPAMSAPIAAKTLHAEQDQILLVRAARGGGAHRGGTAARGRTAVRGGTVARGGAVARRGAVVTGGRAVATGSCDPNYQNCGSGYVSSGAVYRGGAVVRGGTAVRGGAAVRGGGGRGRR
jgi:hypothetical protein